MKNIKKAIELKKQLEKDIVKKLNEFMQETDFIISHIHYTTYRNSILQTEYKRFTLVKDFKLIINLNIDI